MLPFDYVVLVLYLLLMVIIGWLSGRVVRGKDDYFLAGRGMGFIPIGLSVMVTSFSAINYVSIPNEVFAHGLYVIASFPVFFLVAYPISRWWIPYFWGLRVTSVYEFFELRYDRRVRFLASGMFLVWRFVWMSTVLYASGKIMQALTWFPLVAMILVCGLVATLYTTWGGMRAVMFTDVAQFIVLFGGIALGVGLAFWEGGFEVIRQSAAGGCLRPFKPFDPDYLSLDPRHRMTLWSALIGVSVTFLSRYGADQVVMQRYFTARDLASARRGLWLNAWVSVISLSLLSLLGLCVFSHACHTHGVDGVGMLELIRSGKVQPLDSLGRLICSFPVGVTGLVASGLMAATMSSIDSGLNSCVAAYVVDFGGSRERSSWMVFVTGIAVTLLSLLMIPLFQASSGLFVVVNKFVNALGSPLLGMVLLGLFSRVVTGRGLLYGGVAGFFASLAISFFVKPLALQYYAAANLLATLLCCYLASAILKGNRARELSET